jgi:cell division septum initiation protein DivIVA
MDILHLVDRLEEIFNESRAIPFTHSVIVDEDKVFELIDQMRVCIPDEIKKSQQLLAQRDRILAQAQEESNRTVQLAREKTEQLVDQNSIVQAAQVRAEQIINQGRQEADNFRRDADDYQLESLTKMELEIERLLNQVRNGISVIQSEKGRPKE